MGDRWPIEPCMSAAILALFAEAQAFVSVKRRRRQGAHARLKPHYIWFEEQRRQHHRKWEYARRFCLWCGVRLAQERTLRKVGKVPRHCSHKCRMADQWFRKATTKTEHYRCDRCGREFDGRGWIDRRKYCSAECKVRAKAGRASREWRREYEAQWRAWKSGKGPHPRFLSRKTKWTTS